MRPRKILFFTNSEYGQMNVIFSVAHQLALRSQVEIHIASFSVIARRFEIFKQGLRDAGSDATVYLHHLKGLSLKEAQVRSIGATGMPHPPGMRGAIASYQRLPYVVAEWTGPEYMELYHSCEEVIKEVAADAVVIEYFFSQAVDACRVLGLRFIVITPNSPKDIVGRQQPWLAAFWKYPVMSSGLPYPIPWHRIPENIVLTGAMIYYMLSSTKIKELIKHRKKVGITCTIAMFEPGMADAHYLCPATPKTDFPCIIPSNVTQCGPLLVHAASVQESDPGLSSWLDKAPTVLVNLGTHAISDEPYVRQMAVGLRMLLDKHSSVQILWKIVAEGDIQNTLDEVLGAQVQTGRVKILKWLEAEPLAILRHPNTICSVYHGGANSFFEAVHTGTPHIVLPMWYDCYDYATRAEWLGIGIWANKQAAPNVEAVEFGRALIKVVCDREEATRTREAARILAEDTQKYSGPIMASDKILELAARPEYKYTKPE